jgi:hypothetical protein
MYVATANEHGSVECGLGCAQGVGALTMDGSGLFGTGIFGTGVTLTDFSTWGAGEIAAVALSLFVLFSVVGSTKRGAEKVRRGYRTVRRKVTA